jgi:hypothetical protein
MAEENGPLHEAVGYTKDFSVLLREICVVALFCLLFFWPAAFKSLLNRAGIKTVPTPFGDIDVASTSDSVATINRGLSDSVACLQEIQDKTKNATANCDIQQLKTYLQDLQQQAQSTDETLKTNLVQQQTAAAQASPATAKPTGWLFAGQVDESKMHWSGEGPKNVPASLSPVWTINEKLTVTSSAYIHADAASGSHFAGNVIYVVPANSQVQVVADPQYSHAIAGGFFCWLKVQPL